MGLEEGWMVGRALEPLVGSRYSRRGGGAQGLKEWLDEERCYYMRGGAGVMRCWRRGGVLSLIHISEPTRPY